MLRPDQLRLTACLAHTVPGVNVELTCSNDERLIVAHHRLDAHFSPCELRTALIAVAGNEFDLPDHAVDVRLLPDRELGVTAVRIICEGAFAGRVDAVASWALAACMVDELLTDLHPDHTNTRNYP
jgi:hypothetical protein